MPIFFLLKRKTSSYIASCLFFFQAEDGIRDRKSTRLNSSPLVISYAVFCLKKKKINSSHLVISSAFLFLTNKHIHAPRIRDINAASGVLHRRQRQGRT